MSLKTTVPQDVSDTLPPAISGQELLLIALVITAAVLLAINLLPLWLPGLALSAIGDQPKIFWYLSRGSAVAAYWILWLFMWLGGVVINKKAQFLSGLPPGY
jgi:hypothetical protein